LISDAAARIRVDNAIHEIELLELPINRILELFREEQDMSTIQAEVIQHTRFSAATAARYMTEIIPAKITYCIESGGTVVESGSTLGTHPYHQWPGNEFHGDPYRYYSQYSTYQDDQCTTHWWVFDTTFNIPDDPRPWRDILTGIADDLQPPEGILKFKRSINGKISGAHSSWLNKHPNSAADEFIADMILRFNLPEYQYLLEHPEFLVFVRNRCQALLESSSK